MRDESPLGMNQSVPASSAMHGASAAIHSNEEPPTDDEILQAAAASPAVMSSLLNTFPSLLLNTFPFNLLEAESGLPAASLQEECSTPNALSAVSKRKRTSDEDDSQTGTKRDFQASTTDASNDYAQNIDTEIWPPDREENVSHDQASAP